MLFLSFRSQLSIILPCRRCNEVEVSHIIQQPLRRTVMIANLLCVRKTQLNQIITEALRLPTFQTSKI